MPLNELPDLQTFYNYCRVDDAGQENGEPMIEVYVDPGFALMMLVDNSEENSRDKTYQAAGGPTKYKIPLRSVLGTHWQSSHGTMEAIDPQEIESLDDAVSPYAHAIDYKLLMEHLYELIEVHKAEIMRVIDTPPYIHELTRVTRFPSVKVDAEAKILRIARSELASFPNPLWPSRCLQDIVHKDGFKVFLVDENGIEEEFTDPSQIWGEEEAEKVNAALRDRGI